jgi:hypothetical protein
MSEKPKKVLSPEQLEKLKVARERALEVRQTNAKNKALEKELATAEKEQHLNTVKEKLAKVKAPVKVEIEPDSEPETEPEPVIVKSKKKKPKKIVIVEDSESDDEQQQVIFVKRKKEPAAQPVPVPAAPPKAPNFQDDDPYQRHYNAIFGNPKRFHT